MPSASRLAQCETHLGFRQCDPTLLLLLTTFLPDSAVFGKTDETDARSLARRLIYFARRSRLSFLRSYGGRGACDEIQRQS